jgi:N6-L-threonylcarbamoyladenine synthase
MLTLGIETSCDETSIAVVKGGREILANVVASSLPLHEKYGGVVPEIATRHHVEVINYVLKEALQQAQVDLQDLQLLCVTYGPGLVGSLLIGIAFAKALSLALKVPLVAVNHLRAHLYAAGLEAQRDLFPFLGLIVSGGHSNLVYFKDVLNCRNLGQTRDDACGEAYDKVAKILGLGYPGGARIDGLASKTKQAALFFPRPDLGESLDFSFSGLKTAVLYYTKKHPDWKKNRARLAAGFQEAAVDSLVNPALRALAKEKQQRLIVGGGVACNSRLRERLLQAAKEKRFEVYLPSLRLCLDNAAMVAGLGYALYQRGKKAEKNFSAQPNLPIERI